MAGIVDRLRRATLFLLPPVVVVCIRRLRRCFSRETKTSIPNGTVECLQEAGSQSETRKYWGLHDLDCQIEKHLDFDGGYFVELGANDGKLASNTLYYEQVRNWRGVLIEPAPNLYIRCRENRASENHIVCAACVSSDYHDEFVKLIYSNSMSVSLNVDTDIGDPIAHAELGRQFLAKGETVFTFGALARTLNSILIEANAPKVIDFLSLDVEGSEVDVLKGVDHGAFRFRYMLIECRNIHRLEAYLDTLSYCLVEKFNEHDYLFRHSDISS